MTNKEAYRYIKRVYLTTKNDSYREALSVALDALLAHAEAAEKEVEWLKMCIELAQRKEKEAESRAEKAERERDEAVSDLREAAIESCAECMYCLYKATSFCWNCREGSNWKWRGIGESNEEKEA